MSSSMADEDSVFTQNENILMSSSMADEDSRNDVDLHTTIDNTFEFISSLWVEMYGANDSKKECRLEKVQKKFVVFSEEISQFELERKEALIARIQESGTKIVQLEKLLKLDKENLQEFKNDNTPLVEVDALLLNIIDKYKIIQESRLENLASLEEKEVTLCAFLDIPSQKLTLANGVVPSQSELETLNNRILKLEQEKAVLIQIFAATKAELATLLQELGIKTNSNVELSALSNDDDLFPVSKVNLRILEEKRDQYRQTKVKNIAEVQKIRRELSTIWPRMKRDPKDLEELFSQCSGHSKSVIDKLKQELDECKAYQKRYIKDMIQSARTELVEWWDKCCLNEDERNQFVKFHEDVYDEELLICHDEEIEKFRTQYENYKQMYDLIRERRTMWDRLEHLENLAKDPSRLFNNRGGQLLQEEKERKTLQKEILKIEKKLKSLVIAYEKAENKPFLYYGECLSKIIRRDWDEREAQKENEKIARKIANLKTIETESKLGSKPTLSATKRKLGTSQSQIARKIQKTNASTPIGRSKQARGHNQMGCTMNTLVARTPNRAASTPDLSIASVASYNTFQENLDPQMLTPAARNRTKTSSKMGTPKPSSQIPLYGKKH